MFVQLVLPRGFAFVVVDFRMPQKVCYAARPKKRDIVIIMPTTTPHSLYGQHHAPQLAARCYCYLSHKVY